MSERTKGAYAALSKPRIYEAFKGLVGTTDSQERYAREVLRARPGERILDIGCGTAKIAEHLPDVTYRGFDINPDYIETARENFAERPGFEFECVDVREAEVDAGAFDLVSVMGVIHHLDDAGAESLLDVASRAMAPGGRMIALEPAFWDGQRRISRWLASRDRGASVRNLEGYAELAEPYFGKVTTTVREDLLRIPYPLIVIEATAPRSQDRGAQAGTY